MSKNILKAAAVLAGLGAGYYGFTAVVQADGSGCAHDGDGQAYLVDAEGNFKDAAGWDIDFDGRQCVASNGGNTPPEIKPLVGFITNDKKLQRFDM